MVKKVTVKVAQLCLTLQPHELYRPWNSLGQDNGVVSLSLLQGIFPTQGSNPGLPHCRRILHQLSHHTIQGYYKTLTVLPTWWRCGAVVSDSLRPHGLQLTRFLCPRDSPGENTGVGCHFFLLQGIFRTQGAPAMAGRFFLPAYFLAALQRAGSSSLPSLAFPGTKHNLLSIP